MSVHPCAILADKNGYGWSFAEKVHTELVGKKGLLFYIRFFFITFTMAIKA